MTAPEGDHRPLMALLDDYQDVALTSADWSDLTERHRIVPIHEHVADPADLARRIAGCEVIVAMRERTPIGADLLDQLPRLRLVVTTGMRNAAIDLDAATERGILVCGTPTRPAGVSELVIGMLIAVTRSISIEDAAMRRGDWQHTIGPSLQGRTLGLLGLGTIGSRVALLANAFEMDVVAWTPSLTAGRAAREGVRAVSQDELLAVSDALSIHVPLAPSTRGLIGRTQLSRMKRSAYLINTSRGPIVDEHALVEALRSGTIAGAALDVYDTEPLPVDHPLRSVPNALLLPHLGYVTTDTYRVFYEGAVAAIKAFESGDPVRVLNPPAEPS